MTFHISMIGGVIYAFALLALLLTIYDFFAVLWFKHKKKKKNLNIVEAEIISVSELPDDKKHHVCLFRLTDEQHEEQPEQTIEMVVSRTDWKTGTKVRVIPQYVDGTLDELNLEPEYKKGFFWQLYLSTLGLLVVSVLIYMAGRS